MSEREPVRDRERGKEDGGPRGGVGGSRDLSRSDGHSRSRRSRSRSGSRRREKDRGKDRDRGRDRDRDRDRDDRKRSRSRKHRTRSKEKKRKDKSRSRSPVRRRPKKPSNFDLRPEEVDAQKKEELKVAALAFSGINTQQTKHARCIYIGGVDNVADDELKEFWQDAMDRCLGYRTNSIVSAYVNVERKFGFIELDNIELTTACMELDGIMFRGQPLKVRRPTDYNPALVQHKPIPYFNVEAVGLKSGGPKSQVAEGPNKVFVGGLPHHLSDQQITELLEAFGKLKALHVVREPGTSVSKGYAFCEYEDPNCTDLACQGLDGLELGDRQLTVRRAMALPNVDVGSMSGANIMAMSSQPAPAPGIPSITPPPLSQPVLSPPSRVLVFENMVTKEDLEDDDEYKDICHDIESECAKSGKVISIFIPREGPGLEKVFVEFERTFYAVEAKTKLDGRTFANQTVKCDFFDEKKYYAREFI